jgi:hypothetical protein
MKRLFTMMLVVVVAAMLASASLASAAEIQGKVARVDPSGRWMTLDTGIQLMIPTQVKVDRQALQPGTDVKVSYETQGSEHVVTSIEVRPATK